MFIAMNRFRIAPGMESAFEEMWLTRESHLSKVPGFREFHLLKGQNQEDHILYASHVVWDSRESFEAWTGSQAFLKAHARARAPQGTILGPPQLEQFEVIL